MTDVSAPSPQDDALSPPTFDVLPLSPETRAALAKMGYEHPTPVQRAVFEPATRGKDLVVQARTGTGKTTAFGLPIVESTVRRSLKAVQVLALCPTRELALQVSSELEKIGEGRQIKPVAVYGGAPMGRQIDAIAAGAQVVVGTPGRVLDHIRRGTLDTSNVKMLVLDEADEMMSMGFERELTAILDSLPKDRQTLLFSATLPPDIERMARDRLKGPEFLTLSGDAVGALSISHFIYLVTEDKASTLVKIVEVENPESAVVFCNTKVETENVATALMRAGFDADWLNGDLPQSDREEVMGRTKRGQLRFLVATDVAARGIDISHLTHVINFDFPDSAEQYVHRTGRTGRAGRTGTAISLVRPKDIGNLYLLRLTYKIRPFERQLPSAGELKTRREADLMQVVSEAFASRPVHPDDLLLARRLLTHDRAEAIVAGLLRDHLGERQVADDNAGAARRAKPPPPPPARHEASSSPPVAARGAPGDAAPSRPARPSPEPPRSSREPRLADDASGRGPRERGPDRLDPRPLPARDTRDPRDRGPAPLRERSVDAPEAGGGPKPPAAPASASPALASPAAPSPTMPAMPAMAGTAREAPRDPASAAAAAAPAPAPAPPTTPASPGGARREGGREPAPTGDGRDNRESRDGRRGRGGPVRSAPAEDPVRYTVTEADTRSFDKPVHATGEAPRRPGDLVNWHPAEEEGDDKPIFAGAKAEAPRRATPVVAVPNPAGAQQPASPAAGPPPALVPSPAAGSPALVVEAPPAATGAGSHAVPPPGESGEEGDADDDRLDPGEGYVLIYVNIGRRDGARPSDFQRALRERGNISRRETGRIRVRDKHALVAVRREVLARALEALTGADIAGCTAHAEPAKDRGVETE